MSAPLAVGNSALVSFRAARERPNLAVKLLVLAQTPPPLHGQSVMVQAMVDGLQRRGLEVHHVNIALSRDSADIGRWRPGKVFATLGCAWRTIRARFTRGCDVLYYVPAPPEKRGALYRDWTLMLLCRPFFRHVVLHWHAAGLGEWLRTKASGLERLITRALLGRATLAIVLAESLRDDAIELYAKRIAVVPNGVPGPPSATSRRPAGQAWQAVFLGMCSEEKGLFAAVDAIIAANGRSLAAPAAARFHLVAAGAFPDPAAAAEFQRRADAHPGLLRHVGFLSGTEKETLLSQSDCLLFPTRYVAEALPLVVLEALAHDLPVIATRWRGLPDAVPPDCGRLVAPGDSDALADAIIALAANPPPPGRCRAHYLANFQLAQHLDRLAGALASLPPTVSATAPAEKSA